MKKIIVFLCIFVIFPLNVLGIASEVILGGKTIGIEINSNGVMVIGFYKINGKYLKTELKEGDVIVKVGNTKVSTTEELTKAIEDNIDYETGIVEITYLHDDKEKRAELKLLKTNDIYKTGLYVKDKITGIGTLTFIDPSTNTYGALGHEIIENNTSKIIEVKTGMIFKNSITNIDISKDGSPGSKNAKFYYNTTYGDIKKNTKYGIYGEYKDKYSEDNLIAVASSDEIKIGNAKIYTVLNGEKVEDFDIYITKINENSSIKNLTFLITDEKLLDKTGGIVQGMSGSPIVQNDKIIGAVTHVITDNVKTGYGLFITTMLEESER